VFANDFRNPILLAQEAATIDLLSDERLECGIGNGWLRDDYVTVGLPFDPPATRIQRLAEAVYSRQPRPTKQGDLGSLNDPVAQKNVTID